MTAAAEYVHPNTLVPWDDNPRFNDESVAGVMNSIEIYGFASPIIARKETRQIIAGHTRWKAANELGLETVPVRFMDVTASQARQLAVADNKLGEVATWDDDRLASVLQTINQEMNEFDFGSIGFSGDEIEVLLEDSSELSDTLVDEDFEGEPETVLTKIVVEIYGHGPEIISREISEILSSSLTSAGYADDQFTIRSG
jgi:site-specific DNA-methyltransferase (adenine-specific)